jgi:hypothetical protein
MEALMLSLADCRDILQIRRDFAVLRAEWRLLLCNHYARKFDRLQPRKPRGPGGGQWTNDDAGAAASQNSNDPVKVAAQPAAYCWNQMLVDMLLCGSLRPNWYRAACRSQANERYGACIAGRPIPPLPF